MAFTRRYLEGGVYFKGLAQNVAFIGGWRLLEGGVYWRVAFIGGWRLCEAFYHR